MLEVALRPSGGFIFLKMIICSGIRFPNPIPCQINPKRPPPRPHPSLTSSSKTPPPVFEFFFFFKKMFFPIFSKFFMLFSFSQDRPACAGPPFRWTAKISRFFPLRRKFRSFFSLSGVFLVNCARPWPTQSARWGHFVKRNPPAS